MSDQIRVRFAPSPTGDLHIGNARTALFNYLFARHNDGQFVLRIEDTDVERSTAESTQGIFEALEWLGLDYDEGPVYQSKRGKQYEQAIASLHDSGHAYRCFCSKERLAELRERQMKEKRPLLYDRKCFGISREESEERAKNGEAFVWRFHTADEGTTEWEDLVRGRTSFENKVIGDFVIARADGSPVFLLAGIVDDADMGITHVIRGEDHISNTPKQILILRGLGSDVPQFAHLPMILGPDKQRLSKRHGAVSTLSFRAQGILPQALFNYLALLGWSLDDKTEVIGREDLIRHFTLDRVNKAAAVFDYEKLQWMNGHYIRELSLDELVEHAREAFKQQDFDLSGVDDIWFKGIVAMSQERAKTLNDIPKVLGFFLRDELEYEEKAVKKFLKKPNAEEFLKDGRQLIEHAEPFDREGLENVFRYYVEEREVGFGKVAQPLRVALTGSSASPGLFETMEYLGRDRCLQRIDRALETFFGDQ